jgi:hypothetical protein
MPRGCQVDVERPISPLMHFDIRLVWHNIATRLFFALAINMFIIQAGAACHDDQRTAVRRRAAADVSSRSATSAPRLSRTFACVPVGQPPSAVTAPAQVRASAAAAPLLRLRAGTRARSRSDRIAQGCSGCSQRTEHNRSIRRNSIPKATVRPPLSALFAAEAEQQRRKYNCAYANVTPA